MPKLPRNHEQLIGSPQVIARLIEMDGKQLLVRLQKPFEEPTYDDTLKVKVTINKGVPKVTPVVKPPKDDSYIRYGCALVVECWSEATKSVVTVGVKRTPQQTEEEFAFGVRYMMNHATDDEIVNVLRTKSLDIQLKYQCSDFDSAVLINSPPKLEKKS